MPQAIPIISTIGKIAPVAAPIIGGLFGKGKNEETGQAQQTSTVTPNIPSEASGAQAEWWKRLQEWGSPGINGEAPTYGGISPDWGNIWDMAQRRIKEYYQGGPLSTGLVDKVRASAARRNVGDNPATDFMLARVGAQQGREMNDLATNQALAQAEFGERARQNWLQSLTGLANLKNGGQTSTVNSTESEPGLGMGDLVSTLGKGLPSIIDIFKRQPSFTSGVAGNVGSFALAPFRR